MQMDHMAEKRLDNEVRQVMERKRTKRLLIDCVTADAKKKMSRLITAHFHPFWRQKNNHSGAGILTYFWTKVWDHSESDDHSCLPRDVGRKSKLEMLEEAGVMRLPGMHTGPCFRVSAY